MMELWPGPIEKNLSNLFMLLWWVFFNLLYRERYIFVQGLGSKPSGLKVVGFWFIKTFSSKVILLKYVKMTAVPVIDQRLAD